MTSISAGNFNVAAFHRAGIQVSNKPIPAETIAFMKAKQANDTNSSTTTAPAAHSDASAKTKFEAQAAAQTTNSIGKDYDFSNMTRQEIENAGKKLFEQGKISIDEMFRFQHPDGKLRMGLNGEMINFNPNERIDFISHTQQAITNMQQTGEANRPDSSYKMMLGLLQKLTGKA